MYIKFISILLLKIYFNKTLRCIPITTMIITYLCNKGISLNETQVDEIKDFILGTACYEPDKKLIYYISNIRERTGATLSDSNLIYIIDAMVKDLSELNAIIVEPAITALQNLYKDAYFLDSTDNEFKPKISSNLNNVKAMTPVVGEALVNNNNTTSDENDTDSEDDDDDTIQNSYLKYTLILLSVLIVCNTIYQLHV